MPIKFNEVSGGQFLAVNVSGSWQKRITSIFSRNSSNLIDASGSYAYCST